MRLRTHTTFNQTLVGFLAAAMLVFGATIPTVHAQPAAETEEVERLLFVDNGAAEVLFLVETITNKPIIKAQNLPAVKISFDSKGPLTKEEALIALESLLSLNGIALTPLGDNLLKAVTFQDVARQVPEFLEGDPRELPPSEKFYTMMAPLSYLSVANNEYTPILEPIMSPAPIGKIVPLPKANSLLLTDTLSNLQRVQLVLDDADRPQQVREEVLFYPLVNMQARDLQARLQALLLNQNSAMGKYFIGNTTIESDERTNQIIVITHPSNVEILNNIVGSFDIDVEPQTTSEVFYIKHAQAIEIEQLLEEVVTGQQQTREDTPSNTPVDPNAPNNNATTPPGGQAGSTPPSGSNTLNPPSAAAPGVAARGDLLGQDADNLQFSEFITIVADERSNSVVVYGTRSDIQQISTLIDKIDVVLAQVLIEVLIAEVTLRQGEVSGLTSLGLRRQGSIGGAFVSTGTPSIGDTPAFNFRTTLDLKDLDVTLGPALSEGKLRVLQAPVVSTTHNQEATINVSESRPFVTGSTTSQINANTTTNTVQFRDVGIQLKVKPLIGSNGIVQMEIEQIVENPTAEVITINDVPQPVIAKREAISFVSVTDQEVIVLAGLQETILNRTDQKVFILGDIPILGEIFNSRDDDNTRRELMIFIKPNVIYTQRDATAIADRTIFNLDNGDRVREYLEDPNMSKVFEEETKKPEPKQIHLNARSSSPRRR